MWRHLGTTNMVLGVRFLGKWETFTTFANGKVWSPIRIYHTFHEGYKLIHCQFWKLVFFFAATCCTSYITHRWIGSCLEPEKSQTHARACTKMCRNCSIIPFKWNQHLLNIFSIPFKDVCLCFFNQRISCKFNESCPMKWWNHPRLWVVSCTVSFEGRGRLDSSIFNQLHNKHQDLMDELQGDKIFVHDILFRHLQFFFVGPFYKLP